ncbi:MAG: ATP-dependent Clp protease ATP-binding subunit [Patescibacteria group bacterium]|nr:ATP-dependent Clp protease ATP-binding subunit [Patescibacteria group bacterium]
MYFNLQKTAIYRAVKWEWFFRALAAIKTLLLVVILIVLGSLVLNGLDKGFRASIDTDASLLGVVCILMFFVLLLWEAGLFFKHKLQSPKLFYSLQEAIKAPEQFNFAGFLDFETAKICKKAITLFNKKAHSVFLKDGFLYFLLKAGPEEIKFIFQRAELSLKEAQKIAKQETNKLKEGPGADFERIILKAVEIASNQQTGVVGAGDMLSAYSYIDPVWQNYLAERDLRPDDIENLAHWRQRTINRQKRIRCWWSYENLLKRGSAGRDWASGYTITLDKFCFDWRDKVARNFFREIIGHEAELKETERILSKEQQRNVLLVGEPGVGRGSIIEALAQKAFLRQGTGRINFKRILQFDIGGLVASSGSPEKAEALLEICFHEAVGAGNVILVIDNFHNFTGQPAGPGIINISGILNRYLALNDFQVIGITTFADFHNIIEKNSAVANLFEKVEVQEVSEGETLRLLENYAPFFEQKNKKFIGFRALREIMKMSGRYFSQNPFPQKALLLLDEAMTFLAHNTKDYILRPEHVQKVVAEKTSVPVETLASKEKDILLNLENLLRQKLVNQEQALTAVASALRRARAEVNLRRGPMGSFLFLGPTGVGKTETAKALANVYFGGEKNIIRLDMPEFQNTGDVSRLIGNAETEGILTTKVKDKPFSLILLDEFEKAHQNILNLFLQILDEGWLTDGSGRKVSFQSTIVIATSNAGAETIRENIQQGKTRALLQEELVDYVLKQGIFRPELANRFDAIVAFQPLTPGHLIEIAGLMLNQIARNLADKGIDLQITRGLKAEIVKLSYSPAFGARAMKRVIQDKIENVLARALLAGEIKRGQKISIDPVAFSIIKQK